MKVNYTAKFEKRYSELPKQIKIRAEKQEKKFKDNPFHPSLHTEKLSPKLRAQNANYNQLSESKFPHIQGAMSEPNAKAL